MCGVVGFINRQPTWSSERLAATVLTMARAVRHRGPDDIGEWTDAASGVALGHSRLAILDLSAKGHQPMTSVSGRFVMVFNGEIYNFRDLRTELSGYGHAFATETDTEVLLTGIEQWGWQGALRRARGMFAVAVWDRSLERLSLARDRIGEKPLYYGWQGSTFFFGSELKAILGHPNASRSIDTLAVSDVVNKGYVPAPRSILDGIRKLPPGTSVVIHPGNPGALPEPVAYWSLADVVMSVDKDCSAYTNESAVESTHDVLAQAVRDQLVADVPVGAFLSGGVDSSLVVALMQAASARPVQTFTIGFGDAEFDESADAARVARYLGTDHHELIVTSSDALEVVPRLARMFDEPFGDSSQIPTFLVSQMARRDVTVALSGDGGDELFAGYNRYTWSSRVWTGIRHTPGPLRRVTARGIHRLPPDRVNAVASGINRLAPSALRLRSPGAKLGKLAGVLMAQSPDDIYKGLMHHWNGLTPPVSPVVEVPAAGEDGRLLLSSVERMMFADALDYLPNDILAKVDRASMAVGLEVRVPLLDPRVIEHAWSLPLEFKLRASEGKWVLRQVLDRYVPRSLIERPKTGFGLPLGPWLRGPLREWAEDLLDENKLRSEGLLDAQVVRSAWERHQSGAASLEQPLWNVLMLEAWLQEWA